LKPIFIPISEEHEKRVIDIFNYYVENTNSAFPAVSVLYPYFNKILEAVKDYPTFAIVNEEQVVGFCFLHAYKPMSAFAECAEFTCFIDKDYTGGGLGTLVLEKIESEAKKIGIKTILSSIAGDNLGSIKFHQKHGFRECGRFESIAKKRGVVFDIVWMQKNLE
jgi:phosphinothricin acetyltransferase